VPVCEKALEMMMGNWWFSSEDEKESNLIHLHCAVPALLDYRVPAACAPRASTDGPLDGPQLARMLLDAVQSLLEHTMATATLSSAERARPKLTAAGQLTPLAERQVKVFNGVLAQIAAAHASLCPLPLLITHTGALRVAVVCCCGCAFPRSFAALVLLCENPRLHEPPFLGLFVPSVRSGRAARIRVCGRGGNRVHEHCGPARGALLSSLRESRAASFCLSFHAFLRCVRVSILR
jgi:hypothetical protein